MKRFFLILSEKNYGNSRGGRGGGSGSGSGGGGGGGGGGCMTSTPRNLGAYSKSALHGGYGYFLSGSVLA